MILLWGDVMMKDQTRRIFFVGNILTVLMIIQVFVYGSFFKSMKNDVVLIDKMSRIRGSVQRVVKAELWNNMGHQQIRKNIDHLIISYVEDPQIMDLSHIEQAGNIKLLQESWQQLLALLDDYHREPTTQKGAIIIDQSELVWGISNNNVLIAQNLVEKNVSYFRYFTLGFILNLIGILITLFIFKKRIYDDLKTSAIHDPLTKAFNRRYFDNYIDNEILRAIRKDKVFCLVMLDIDYFKKVNDTYGHAKGDYVLTVLVEIVQDSIRKYDVLARIGGEEFTILLPDTKLDDGFALAERVRENVAVYPFDGIPPLTISLGVVEFRSEDTSGELLERADGAMYKAKKSGRNRTEIG